MTASRVRISILYVFLVTLTVLSLTHLWSLLTNPYFGAHMTSMPAWFETGSMWLVVVLLAAAVVISPLAVWALARGASWSRRLTIVIGWLTLGFYVTPDLLIYIAGRLLGIEPLPFFGLVSWKTVLLAVLSAAALSVLHSTRFRSEYAAAVHA